MILLFMQLVGCSHVGEVTQLEPVGWIYGHENVIFIEGMKGKKNNVNKKDTTTVCGQAHQDPSESRNHCLFARWTFVEDDYSGLQIATERMAGEQPGGAHLQS